MMKSILSYMYSDARLGENGYAMLSIGILVALCVIVGVIIVIIKNSKGDV